MLAFQLDPIRALSLCAFVIGVTSIGTATRAEDKYLMNFDTYSEDVADIPKASECTTLRTENMLSGVSVDIAKERYAKKAPDGTLRPTCNLIAWSRACALITRVKTLNIDILKSYEANNEACETNRNDEERIVAEREAKEKGAELAHKAEADKRKKLFMGCQTGVYFAAKLDGEANPSCLKASWAEYDLYRKDGSFEKHFTPIECHYKVSEAFKVATFVAGVPTFGAAFGRPPFDCAPPKAVEPVVEKKEPEPVDDCKIKGEKKGEKWKTIKHPGAMDECVPDLSVLNEWERKTILLLVRLYDVVIPSAPAAEPPIPRAPPSPPHAPTVYVPTGKSPIPKSDITGIPEDRAKRKDVGPVTPTPPEHKISPPKGFGYAKPPTVHTPPTPTPTVRAPIVPTPAPTPPTVRPPSVPTPVVVAPGVPVRAPTITGPGDRVGGVKADVRSKGKEEDLAAERDEVLKLLKKPGQ